VRYLIYFDDDADDDDTVDDDDAVDDDERPYRGRIVSLIYTISP
jgi:hypothetical protein